MHGRKSPTINTARLSLHTISDSDADHLIDLLTDNEVSETFMLPEFHSREEALKLFDRLKQLSGSDKHFVYGIYLNNKLIGFINDVETTDTEIELGLVVQPAQKNKGFATEVLIATMQELFRLGYSVVKTGVFEENAASIRVMEKSGMTRLEQTTKLEYRGRVHHCIWFEKRKASAC